jgi:hypothetical protein
MLRSSHLNENLRCQKIADLIHSPWIILDGDKIISVGIIFGEKNKSNAPIKPPESSKMTFSPLEYSEE